MDNQENQPEAVKTEGAPLKQEQAGWSAPRKRRLWDKFLGLLYFRRKIFISYRRDDNKHFTGRIYDRLARRYGRDVIRDVNSIEPGEDWEERIHREIEDSRVFLIIIGSNWVGKNENGLPRICDQKDMVYKEICWALQRLQEKKLELMIPVLFDGAKLPQCLPSEIEKIPTRQYVNFVDDEHFDYDVAKLLSKIKPTFTLCRRFWLGMLVLIALLASAPKIHEWWSNRPLSMTSPAMESFTRLSLQANWIAYDPTGHDATTSQFPANESITADLQRLRSSGFTGIVTFGSEGTLWEIPRLAKQAGFAAVVMGIADPTSADELAKAEGVAQWVDAYCVGHNVISGRYFKTLAAESVVVAMRRVRHKTGKPVTTTEAVAELRSHPELVRASDWLFPDGHAYWHQGTLSPAEAITQTEDAAIAALSLQSSGSSRPIMLKMISYPSGGDPNLSEEKQLAFYQELFNRYDNASSFPHSVRPVLFSAYDVPWKKSPQWKDPEQFTGLFDSNRAPKKAALFLIQQMNQNLAPAPAPP